MNTTYLIEAPYFFTLQQQQEIEGKDKRTQKRKVVKKQGTKMQTKDTS